MTVTQIRKTRTPSAATAAATAPTPGALVDVTDALEDAEALITTAMRSLGADGGGDSPEEVTLGLALQKLRNGMERVRALRTTED